MSTEALSVLNGSNPAMTTTSNSSILGALKASMAIHPVLWTFGTVAVVGAIGYFAFFRKSKPIEVKAS